jgi:hypothetical protein
MFWFEFFFFFVYLKDPLTPGAYGPLHSLIQPCIYIRIFWIIIVIRSVNWFHQFISQPVIFHANKYFYTNYKHFFFMRNISIHKKILVQHFLCFMHCFVKYDIIHIIIYWSFVHYIRVVTLFSYNFKDNKNMISVEIFIFFSYKNITSRVRIKYVLNDNIIMILNNTY